MRTGEKAFKSLVLLILLPFLFSCSSLFYYPSHELFYLPAQLGIKAQEYPFKSQDGTQLYAWYFPSKVRPPKGTLIQFHGNAENMSSHYLSLVWLVSEGYDLISFDYRGYGKSEGEPDQKGTYEDGLAALQLAWNLHDEAHSPRFIVYGQSLGGAIAARTLADFSEKNQVSLLVLDSTFVSYKDVARRKMASAWFTWPFSPLAMVLVSDSYSAEDALKQMKTRLLVIHDRKDPAVPFAGAEKFYAEASAPKEFWVLDQGQHVGVFNTPRSPDRARFSSLLESLSPSSASSSLKK